MRSAARWMERHQVVLYLAAIAAGALVGGAAPDVAGPADRILLPVLGVLLYATFLGVPFARIGRAFRDGRFLGILLVVNFVLVPLIVWPLSRFVAHDDVLLIGVLLVLLTPCVDYVIVFTGLARGASDRLLAAAPVLMLLQTLLLPVFLWAFAGSSRAAEITPGPFVEAFLLLIAVPAAAAALTQLAAARARWAAAFAHIVPAAMVPLMMLTLAVVVASQIAGVGRHTGDLMLVVPVFVLFAVIMVGVGLLAGRVGRLDAPARRAVIFSGVTRNSLVVLPIALALPAAYALAPLVVVTQTLVELVAMVVLVQVVPRLVPGNHRAVVR